MIKHRSTRLNSMKLINLTLAASVLACPLAYAGPLEEVIVTAQKREQSLKEVPVSVVALSADQLNQAGINSTEDLVKVSPSVTFSKHLAPYQSTIRIRGVGSNVSSPAVEPSVSMVVDGVVIARQGSFFTELVDVERAELLRGPQSTLFGKNSVGGLVNIITKQPNMENVDGTVDLRYDEWGDLRVRGTVSGPLSDTFGARLTANFLDLGDSNIDNVNATGPSLDGGDAYGIRGKAYWAPTEAMEWVFIADYSTSDTPNGVRVPVSYESQAVENLYNVGSVDEDNRKVDYNGGPLNRHESQVDEWGVSIQGDWDLDWATLTSITAYRERELESFLDIDGIGLDGPPVAGYDDMLFGPGGLPVLNGKFSLQGDSQVFGTSDSNQFTQEIRFTSPGDQAFRWVAGLYYWKTELEFDNRQIIRLCPFNTSAPQFTIPFSPAIFADGDPGALTGTCSFPPPTGVNISARTVYNVDTEYFAAFGQVDLDITEQLTASVGLRVQRDEFEYDIAGGLGGPAVFPGTAAPIAPFASNNVVKNDVNTWKVSLAYAMADDLSLYGSYSHGYKGPGLDTPSNLPGFSPQPLDEEFVDAAEFGVKGWLFDGVVDFNLALFQQDFEDLQQAAYDADNAIYRAINAGDSRQRGMEAELGFDFHQNLDLRASITYLDAEYTDFDQAACIPAPVTADPDCQFIAGTPPLASRKDVSGEVTPYSPEWSYNVNTTWRQPIGNLLGIVGADLRYVDEIQTDSNQNPSSVIDAYTVVDLRLGVETEDGSASATFFVNNVFDETYAVTAFSFNYSGGVNPINTNSVTYSIPKQAERYVGVRFRKEF